MSISESIKRTIKYSQKYGGELTDEQLFERLIGNKIYTREEISNVKFPISNKKNIYKKEKLEKARELARLIEKNFKNILFLGITGSVAAGYPKKNDDIDIMIITKENRLWITRLELRLFVGLNKIPHRKFGKKGTKDEFCFNLWLDESSLKIRKEKRNLKNAIDLILTKPLTNKEKTYEKFIFSNDWAKKYVATGYSLKKHSPAYGGTSLDRVTVKNIWDKVVNWLVFWPQFWYMKKKIRREKVGLHEAFFHR
jgi:predicted nucleotidyltransferase